MTKKTTFIPDKRAQEVNFANQAQGKKDSSKGPLRNPLEATFGFSKTQALRGILLLTQVFSAISPSPINLVRNFYDLHG